jgi:hypothetical protein
MCLLQIANEKITLFARAYERLSVNHSAVFFSYNKSASTRISQTEIIQRTE